MLVGTEAEVLDSLTGVLGAAEEEGVGTSGLLKSQLVKGDGLAAGGNNAGTGGGGEAKGSDLGLGALNQAVVVGDGADNDNGLLLVAVLQVACDARQGDGRAVGARHKEAAKDNLVEAGVGPACMMGKESSVSRLFFCLNWESDAFAEKGSVTYGPGSGRASPRA